MTDLKETIIKAAGYVFIFTRNKYEEESGGTLTSDLFEDSDPTDTDDENTAFKQAKDVIESLVLAQYCAGIDVTTKAYIQALETSIGIITDKI